jgi:hypothetical protein
MAESLHHMLWARRSYKTKHEKALRSKLVIEVDWLDHRELHAQMQPPHKPSLGVILCVLESVDGVPRDQAPLTAIERLYNLDYEEPIKLADHLVRQLGILGISYGEA